MISHNEMGGGSRENAARKFKIASFFTGIGGIDVGFENAGFSTVFQCEINEFCYSILNKHWENVPKQKDIKNVTTRIIPASDIWVGGFPCQDLSLARAGPRAGLKGARSGLFHEFARLIGEGRPRIVLLENVHGLLNSHKGNDFENVIQTLAQLGYSVGWRVLNSKNFGVPQSRQRIYIVGCYQDRDGPAKILFEPERGNGNAAQSETSKKKPLSPFKRVIRTTVGSQPVVQAIAYCLCACSARHTGTDWSRTYISYPHLGKVRRPTPTECEGIMGFPENWTIPNEKRYNEDILDTLRYHALGNAVTPPVAEWIASRIKNYLETNTNTNTNTTNKH
jgi:DNA (cytosine-5)-methyltransferase 1